MKGSSDMGEPFLWTFILFVVDACGEGAFFRAAKEAKPPGGK